MNAKNTRKWCGKSLRNKKMAEIVDVLKGINSTLSVIMIVLILMFVFKKMG